MNMAIGTKEDGSSTYLIGVCKQALHDYTRDPKNGIISIESIRIKDAETLGPGKEKIEQAKEEIRAGKAWVIDLGFELNVIVFQ